MAVPKEQDLVVFFSIFLFLGSFVREPRAEARTLDPQEVEVLKKIKEKMNVTFWDFSVDPCDATGAGQWFVNSTNNEILRQVECGNCNNETDVCHITSIQLKSQNLTGVLPEELGNLTFLAQLDLTLNYLNGTIPTSWGSLPLVNLSLIVNRITGEIPGEIGNINTLKTLLLEDNMFQGQIPAALGNLHNLTSLMLSANNFTGEIPEELGNLKNLNDFRIDGNAITGNIPNFIANWTKLTRLDMQGTSLSGPFPDSFAAMEELTELRITDYKGDGSFPGLQQNKKLTYLILRNCSISGQIPNFIGDLSELSRLDLSFNNLSGEIPSSLSNLKSSFNYLFLTNNMLNGTVPDWILSSVQKWDISFNYFTDPQQTSCTGQVSSSALENNNIRSCLKRNYPCSGKLKNYQFFINCGGGMITVDDKIYEDNNTPQGPSYFVESGDGKWAFSNSGYFLGKIDAKYVTGNTSILNMKNPEQYYMTARLSPMSLRYYGLCLQRGNYNVSLYFAEIMFTDDETFSSLGRRIFDVSIQGNKVLKDFNIVEEANGTGRGIVKSFNIPVENGTLDIHLQWLGKGTTAVPSRGVYGPLISAISVTPNFTPHLGEHEISTGAIVGIVIGCCIFVLLILLAALFYLRKYKKEKSELDGLDLQTGFFSLKQIKSATHDFDPENKIGEGGFGPVYKGILPDGSFIAVKRLSGKSKQGNREFVTEIGMISALQHPNLVKLYGCCIDGKQLFLIYEYLENNSLARALFGREGTKLNIDWPTRRKICIGIARGLAYLHEESVLKIIHRDIKATNILLDKDLNAKISDFGLAKLDEEENTHISTRIAGTLGYMSPEYAMRGYLTHKADVYSFGIVVLELISGKSNANYMPEDSVYLLDWMRLWQKCLDSIGIVQAYVLQEQGRMLELVDPCLGSNYSRKEVEDMLNMSLQCTNISPTLRPKMSTVVSMLEGTIITEPTSKRDQHSASNNMRFMAFQSLSQDSQIMSNSSDAPWSNTADSATSKHESLSDTIKLMDNTD